MTEQRDVAVDATAFVARAELITNNALLDEGLRLFHDDCVAEWIFDGVYQRHDGIQAIRPALTAMIEVFREHDMSGRKTLQCFDGTTIVNSWRGGFHGDDRQFGTELWTLRDGLVVHHQMYIYLALTPRASLLGQLRQLRILLTSPRIALATFNQERRAARSSQ